MSIPATWTAIEDAIHTWVRVSSGLAASNVFWSDEAIARPAPPYITISRPNIRGLGQDWRQTEDNPTPTPGAEIVHYVRGHRVLEFTLQCFDGARSGASSAPAILERVRTGVRLPSIHAGLRAAQVGVASFGNVVPLNTAQLGAARFEPRAILEFSAFVPSEVSETTTYIQHVEVTREAPDPEITFTVSRED